MRCIVVIIAAIAIAIIATAVGASAKENTLYVSVDEGTYLRGRKSPSLDAAVEMKLYNGEEVTVVSAKGEWVEIEGGEPGTVWCYSEFLKSSSDDADCKKYEVVSNGKVRVRKEINGEKLRYVRNGDILEVKFFVDGWAYLGDGYIMQEFLKEIVCEDTERKQK